MSRSSAPAALPVEAASPADIPGYLGRSARPLTSLVFLLPFVVLYELGTRYLLTDAVQGTQHIVAFTLLRKFFALFGANARHLPALALVAILLSWHIARKDVWSIKLGTLLGMIVESIALAVPLMVLAVVLARLFPLAAPAGDTLTQTLVLSLGAGIYEELVFRLMLCTSLALLLNNVLKIKPGPTLLLVVVLSAFAFSAYHYLGNEAFDWRIFTFRAGAGVYFAALFGIRGFGVTAGSHMAYDILITVV